MMLSEFIERTGFEPMADEYAEIEEAYYGFDGDKNAFCKHWLETVGVEGICKARAEKIKQLRATMLDIEKSMMADNAEMKKQIAKLEANLRRSRNGNLTKTSITARTRSTTNLPTAMSRMR